MTDLDQYADTFGRRYPVYTAEADADRWVDLCGKYSVPHKVAAEIFLDLAAFMLGRRAERPTVRRHLEAVAARLREMENL